MKIHHKTQKAINQYAKALLKFYREEKKKDSFIPMARFKARMRANVLVNANVYVEIANRQLNKYPRF